MADPAPLRISNPVRQSLSFSATARARSIVFGGVGEDGKLCDQIHPQSITDMRKLCVSIFRVIFSMNYSRMDDPLILYAVLAWISVRHPRCPTRARGRPAGRGGSGWRHLSMVTRSGSGTFRLDTNRRPGTGGRNSGGRSRRYFGGRRGAFVGESGQRKR